jgi:hypothetical protein
MRGDDQIASSRRRGLDMTYAVNSVDDAVVELSNGIKLRNPTGTIPQQIKLIRTPVALVFVRGDQAEPGSTLAKQVVASYAYWNEISAKYFDIVFFGWYNDAGNIGFNHEQFFIQCYEHIQKISKWHYSGETDILLLDFEIPVGVDGTLGAGAFSFKRCIPWKVTEIIQEKNAKIYSLDGLMQELITVAKKVYDKHPLQASVFEISDEIGWIRGRRGLLDAIVEFFLQGFSKVYKELKPFAVCDLRLAH